MLHFENLFNDALALIGKCGAEVVEIPKEFASVEKALGKGSVSLHTQIMRLASVGEFRTVYICGERVEILNMFFFPEADKQLPVYAMEYVVLGIKFLVAVIDIKSVSPEGNSGGSKNVDILTPIKMKYCNLSYSEDMPDWYLSCRSENDIFVRPSNIEETVVMSDVCVSSLQSYSMYLESPCRVEEKFVEQHADNIMDYKTHHRENSPGLPFLNRVFGEMWTQSFMSDCLFA